MATTSPAPTECPALRSNNRRRGWVIASEDGSEVERPTSFDARRSAAAWNKGNGPSKASIPSRASSLASPAASPTIPSAALHSAPIETPSTSSTTTLENRPVPPPRVPSSSGGHGRDESITSTDAESSTGKRRPSPPLLAPPKQTYRKVPSTRALPPSAWSDHQKFMAAAGAGPRPTSLHTAFFSTGSSSTASASQSLTAKKAADIEERHGIACSAEEK
ncbi:hypothetical protein NDA18_003233 [Ustilago nuda]|nr:hypothetical protein NDA18_003233 [Ustilago nuda]